MLAVAKILAAAADEHLHRGTDDSRQEPGYECCGRPAPDSDAQKPDVLRPRDREDEIGKESEPPHQPHEQARD